MTLVSTARMPPPHFRQYALLHLFQGLRLALVVETAEDLVRRGWGEQGGGFQQHAVRRFLDRQPRAGIPLPTPADRCRQDDLALGGEGGGGGFCERGHGEAPRCKTNVR